MEATAGEKLASLQQGQSDAGTVNAIATGGHAAALAATGVAAYQGASAAYAVGGAASVGCFAAPLIGGLAGVMVGASAAKAVGADKWLAGKLGGAMLAQHGPHPAHVTHPIAHSQAFAGALSGLLVGALVAAAVVVAVGATVATGGLAGALLVGAAGGLAGGFVGAMIAGAGAMMANVTGAILKPGSPNVCFEGKPAARVTDLCSCSKCGPAPAQIAEGSSTVFINGLPLARVGHKTTCGATVQQGCSSLYSGDPTRQYGPINSDVSILEQVVLSGAEVGLALSAVKFRSSATGKQVFGEPVEPGSGDYVDRRIDLDYRSVLPLQLVRSYVGRDPVAGLLGCRWICNWSQRLRFERDDQGQWSALLEDGGGQQLLFVLGYRPEFTARHLKAPYYHLTGTRDCARLFDSRTQQTLVFTPAADTPDLGQLTAIEDGNRNRIAFHYQGRQLRRITHSDGIAFQIGSSDEGWIHRVLLEGDDRPAVTYDYGDAGELLSVSSAFSGAFHYRYSPEGWLNHWHDSGVTQVDLDYDQAGRVIGTRTPEGLYNDRFLYFPEERKSVYIDATGGRTSLWYDRNNLLIRKEDPCGHVTEQEWDGFERLVSRTDALGRVTRFDHDALLGTLEQRIDWLGRTTRYQWNRLGLITGIDHPDGRHSRWNYDEHGNLLVAERADGAITRYRYDDQGRLLTRTAPDRAITRWEYDAQGHLSRWFDPMGHVSRCESDPWGRLLRVTDPEQRSTRYRFAAGAHSPRIQLQSIQHADGGQERLDYDREGQLEQVTGAEGQITRYQHGAFDLLLRVTDPAGQVTRLDYDRAARLQRITNAAGRSWQLAYDPAGQLAAETDWAGRTTRYQRDPLGRVLVKRLPDGVEQRLDWDEHDRIAGVSTGSGRIRYEYDDQDRLVRALTFAGSEASPETELAFRYDEAGQLVEETQNGVPVAYRHDAAGRLTGRVSPSGATTFDYDRRGLLAGYASNGHRLSFTRNAAGQETVRTSGPNAFTLRQSYDGRGRLALQLAGRSRTEVGYLPEAHRQAPALEVQGELRRGYDWDRSGRLVGVTDQARGASRYAYDARDQVQSVQRPDNHTSERYQYNALMDLLNSDGMRHGYQDGEVQSVGNTSYRRDARGRVVQKTIQRPGFRPQSWGFQWDDFDHLVATETPEGEHWRYRYDAFGRRVEKRCLTPVPEGRLQGVTYLWQGATLAEEIQERAGGSRTFRWHFEPGSFRPIAKEVLGEAAGSSTFYPIVTDHLGTPKEVFDLQGTCQWQGEHSLTLRDMEYHLRTLPMLILLKRGL